MKRHACIIALLFLAFSVFTQPVQEEHDKGKTYLFTDSCGRTVEIPADVTKTAPSGGVATMILGCIAPEYMCSVNSRITDEQSVYLPEEMKKLPATGSFYGTKSTLNIESLIKTEPQVIIDIGEYRTGMEADLDRLQNQTGIPCIFIQSDPGNMASAFRILGTILSGKETRAEEIALLIDETMETARVNSVKITEQDKVSVLFSGGYDGLDVNAGGTANARVIELIGAENAVNADNPKSKGYGNRLSIEALYSINPDVIITSEDNVLETITHSEQWQVLDAVKTGKVYRIPSLPYNWMGVPASVNQILGILWLGNLLYPQYYTYDITEVITETYNTLWNCELTDAEINEILGK